MHLTIWYSVVVFYQNDVCEDYIRSVYVGGYCGLSESELCVFGKLCPISFLVVCKCYCLQYIVMLYVDCRDDG